MKTITVDGEEYTKASILAELFGYTSDYIGQLCRANKVDAKLVGRSWYVNEYSLGKHKDTRYEALRANEITNKINVNYDAGLSNIPKVLIRPTLSKLTKRSFHNPMNFNLVQRESLPLAVYEHDDYELVPQSKVTKENTLAVKVPVALSSAVEVPISLEDGNLYKISIYNHHKISPKSDFRIKNIAKEEHTEDTLLPDKSSKKPTLLGPIPEINKSVKAIPSPHFTPQTIKDAESATKNSVSIIPLSLALSLAVALMIITLDTQIITNGLAVNSRLVFTTASLEQIFATLGSLR